MEKKLMYIRTSKAANRLCTIRQGIQLDAMGGGVTAPGTLLPGTVTHNATA